MLSGSSALHHNFVDNLFLKINSKQSVKIEILLQIAKLLPQDIDER